MYEAPEEEHTCASHFFGKVSAVYDFLPDSLARDVNVPCGETGLHEAFATLTGYPAFVPLLDKACRLENFCPLCDGTGFSTTFLPSLVPYSRLYMWLRVLLTSRSLLAYFATFACRVLHLCKLTPSLSVVSLNYHSAPLLASLDYSRSTRSAFPSKFYYLALYYHPSL